MPTIFQPKQSRPSGRQAPGIYAAPSPLESAWHTLVARAGGPQAGLDALASPAPLASTIINPSAARISRVNELLTGLIESVSAGRLVKTGQALKDTTQEGLLRLFGPRATRFLRGLPDDELSQVNALRYDPNPPPSAAAWVSHFEPGNIYYTDKGITADYIGSRSQRKLDALVKRGLIGPNARAEAARIATRQVGDVAREISRLPLRNSEGYFSALDPMKTPGTTLLHEIGHTNLGTSLLPSRTSETMADLFALMRSGQPRSIDDALAKVGQYFLRTDMIDKNVGDVTMRRLLKGLGR